MNRVRWGLASTGVLGALAAVLYSSQQAAPQNPNKQGCDLTMSPRVALVKGVSGTAQTLTFSSRACTTGTVTIFHSEADGGTATMGTCSLSSGSCTYADTLPDQATITVSGSITSGSVTHSDQLRATMDSLNPELSLTTPGLAGDGTLIVVNGQIDPNSNMPLNLHVQNSDPGYVGDAYPRTDAGGHLVLTAVVKGGSDGGSLVTSFGATTLATTALTVTPQTVVQSITLPEGSAGILSLAATIGSGAYTLAIPVAVDTLVPPTPIPYYGDPIYTDGGCFPCSNGGEPSGGVNCISGCGYAVPANGSPYFHIVDQRHADFDAVYIVPPDSGPLWGNSITGQVETEFGCISQLKSTDELTSAVVYTDGGSPSSITFADGGSGPDYYYIASWMCARSDAGCIRIWTP